MIMATGFGGWGMTNGIASGKILADAILERDNPWAEAVDPGRMTIGAIPKMAQENFNAVSHLVGDRISEAQSPELSAIPAGEGAIVQLEDERVAAYRDQGGELHLVTSACTHWGCELRWNSAETTWDCPCHGSRFDIDGTILHGPAVKPLEVRNTQQPEGVE
jgi:Rieske Fe-S protein